MNDSTIENAPTEPIAPTEPFVAAPAAPVPAAAPVAQPVYAAPPAPPVTGPSTASSGKHAAMIVAVVGVAVVIAFGVFVTGVAVGSRMNRGVRAHYALSGQTQSGAPGMMQDRGQYPGMQGQTRGFDSDSDGDGGRGYGGARGHRGGQYYGSPQGFGGQGSTTPTAPVPAVPGQ